MSQQSSGKTTERPKIFGSMEEANKRLPLVMRISADIVHLYPLIDQMLEADRRRNGQDTDLPLSSETERLLTAANDCVHELNELGIEVADLKRGIVHFPTTHQGKPGYFCWINGEESVHRLHSYSVRCPLQRRRRSHRTS